MGDRANIVVKARGEQVCLYSHWGGSELPGTLQDAMKRGEHRWDDEQYLARIIFCEMVKDKWKETTGFGITQTVGDGKDRILTVDVDEQTVQVNDREPISFSDFIANSADW